MHVEFELAHRLADAFSRFNHAFRSRIDKSHHKFFAAIASNNVNFLADFTANRRCNTSDDFITHRMSISIIHSLEVVNIHHQDTDIVLLAIGTNLFGAESFLQRAVVHESCKAVARSKILVLFNLECTGISKSSDPGKRLEEFLFVILIAVGVTAFKANGKFCSPCIRFRSDRHYKQLTKFHIALFGIVQARHIIGIARGKRTEYRAVPHKSKHKDALVRQRKLLIDKLFRIHTDAVNNAARTFFLIVERKNRQTVKRHVFLDVFEHLLVDVLDRHGLEELALVAVKHAELLLFNVILSRDKALEAHHVHRMRNKRKSLGFGSRKRIRMQGVHKNDTQAAFFTIQERHTDQRANHSIFDVIRKALSNEQVAFQNAGYFRAQELAQDAHILGNFCTRIDTVRDIALERSQAIFICTAAIRKNRKRICLRHEHLKATQHIAKSLVDIRICTGPNLVYTERRIRFVGLQFYIIRKFIANVRRDYRRKSRRTLAALDDREHRRIRRETRAVHDSKRKRNNSKRNQEKEHSPLKCQSQQCTGDHK